MCLDYITKSTPKKTGTGWKIFYTDKKHLYGQTIVGKRQKIRPQRKWLKEESFSNGERILVSKSKIPYTRGWHIFKHKSATLWMQYLCGGSVRKVKYRKAIVEGIQFHCDIIVAKEIYIL